MARVERTHSARRPRRKSIAIFTAFALGVVIGPLAAQTPQEVQTIAEQAIRSLNLQTEFPRVPELPRLTLPAEVLWVVVVVAVGALLYAFSDVLPIWRRRGGAWTVDDATPGAVEPHAAAAVLGAADELAGQGRFVEAMHVLLLQGLADIRRRLDEQFADSLTSREILRSVQLPEQGRASLRDIVARVERTYFGAYPAELPDYVACRASFSALAQALQGSAPA